MCTTPLQMLIAEKIIDLNQNKDFDLLVLVASNNNKYNYYFNRLKRKCFDNLYCISDLKINSFYNFTKLLKRKNLNKKYKELYLASIDSRYLQYIVSKNSLSHIYTFDDGTANIISNSLYYSDNYLPKIKKYIWRILGVKYYIKDIREKSKLHYTIYYNIPNIIENIKYISLIPQLDFDSLYPDRVIKFYLGQPLIEINEKFDFNYFKNKLEKLRINYYFPHPREKAYPQGDFEVIDSFLIFEDYIIQFLYQNPNIKVEVYSFISTALLNISSLSGVKCIYLYNDEFMRDYKEFYLFSEKKFNIILSNLENI